MGNSVRYYLGYGYGLVREHVPFGPQVPTRLGYETRLSRLHTLDPPH
jgi:hypothetical protein